MIEPGVSVPDRDEVDDSISTLLGRLIDDAEHFVKAEIALYRAEALHRLVSYRKYIVFAAIGGLLSLCAIILLLMAIVFLLAPFITIAGAALLVAILSLMVAGLLFSVVVERVRKDLDAHEKHL